MNRPILMKPNETTKLLDQLNTICFIIGLRGIWISDVKFSETFKYFYNKLDIVIQICNLIYTMSIIGSFFTQHNLTEKQAMDRLVFGVILPGYISFFYFLMYHKQEVKNLLYHLAVVLREHYNDEVLEREMVKKIKVFSLSLTGLVYMVIITLGIGSLYRVITASEHFVTLITAWPDVEDNSTTAEVMRILLYCWLFNFAASIMTVFSLVVTMLVAISYQFKNLQSYFQSLDGIFSNKKWSQDEKEIKYEQAFIVGIQMHSMTLWCKNVHQSASKEIFGIEIIVFFSTLLPQVATLMGDDRNVSQLSTMFICSICTCLGLGFFMWTGGDITLEASRVSDAIYSSGWHNCRGQSSARVRKLVVNAMRQAQHPVVYRTLGVVEFSYGSYITLVRMPYTAVSVLY